MGETETLQEVARNQATYRRHRRETLWQITVPIIIGGLVVIALATLVSLGTVEQVSIWANTSVVWMILPLLLGGVLSTIFLMVSIYGIIRLIQVLPLYARQVQEFFVAVTFQVGGVSDRVLEPILRAQMYMASLRALRYLFRRKSS